MTKINSQLFPKKSSELAQHPCNSSFTGRLIAKGTDKEWVREKRREYAFFAHSDESSSDPSSNFSVFTFDSASRVMTSFCFRAFRVDSRRGVLSTHNSALFIGVLVWLINRAIT